LAATPRDRVRGPWCAVLCGRQSTALTEHLHLVEDGLVVDDLAASTLM